MKILWLAWKDMSHPLAGGAEVVREELAKRLASDGHQVVFLVGGYKDSAPEQTKHGYQIIRVGNRFTVYYQAYRYYKNHLQGKFDLVLDEINTIPFLAKFYVKERNLLFIHQLAREIWFYELFFPLSLVGYILEPLYLWLLRDRQVVTVSESTKKDLIKYGFKEEKVKIISEGVEIEPLETLLDIKYPQPTLLSLGQLRSMKQTLQIVEAFEIAKEKLKNLKLVMAGAGDSRYGKKVLRKIDSSRFKKDINYLGKVPKKLKIELMQKAHVLAVTSVKEGWCLVITEASSQGTPSIVYDADGLRDSVNNRVTGLICTENSPENLAENIVSLIGNQELYKKISQNALEESKKVTFQQSYLDFTNLISSL